MSNLRAWDETLKPAESEEPLAVKRPISVRGASLPLIAVLLSLAFLRVAREAFIPVIVGILLAYALSPLVAFLVRLRLPRVLATAFALLAIVGSLGAGVYSLRDEASAVLDELPEAAKKVRRLLEQNRGIGATGAIGKVQEVAAQIEKTAAEATGSAPVPGDQAPAAEPSRLRLRNYLWVGWQGATGVATQVILVLFLVFFLLISGDLFKRKLVRIAGPTLSRRRITVQILEEINGQIQRFLVFRMVACLIVTVTIWPALAWAGLDHALIWAIATGLFNIVPYFGPAVITCSLAVVAFLQFGTVSMAALVAGIVIAITSFEGWFVTPKLMGRAARMNEVAVFIGLIFCGWLWGVWGLLLAVPMLMVVKTMCDHIDDVKWIGELLGD